MNNEKIGVGIITCNRPKDLQKCFDSIDKTLIDDLIIVNDGLPLNKTYDAEVKQHSSNQGVGISKNEAFDFLVKENCKHIFIIEDDVYIKNSNVFNVYIDTAKKTGLKHLMWGLHGPANRSPLDYNTPNPRKIIKYRDCIINLNLHCVGAFCYYDREVILNVGANDVFFKNAWEHVEHSYRIYKSGYIPGYWWWPDIDSSLDYLGESNNSVTGSIISKNDAHFTNIVNGSNYFISKHGHSPVEVPDLSVEQVIFNLKKIYKQTHE